MLASWDIPYSGKLSREKTFVNWWKLRFFTKKTFAEKTFTDCSFLLCQWMPHLQISQRKLSQIATEMWKSWKFSPSTVSRYTVNQVNYVHLCVSQIWWCHMPCLASHSHAIKFPWSRHHGNLLSNATSKCHGYTGVSCAICIPLSTIQSSGVSTVQGLLKY